MIILTNKYRAERFFKHCKTIYLQKAFNNHSI